MDERTLRELELAEVTKLYGWAQRAVEKVAQTTAPVLRDLSRRLGIELPITEGVCAVLEGRPLHELAGELMGRRPTDE